MGIMSETIRRMRNRSTMSRRLKESWDPAGAGVDDDEEEEKEEEEQGGEEEGPGWRTAPGEDRRGAFGGL